MLKFFPILLLFVSPVLADPELCNLAEPWRQQNWDSPRGGSCGQASTITGLNWVQEFSLAQWWRQNHYGGEYAERQVRNLKAAGLRYAATFDGDTNLLEYSIQNRRMAIVYWPDGHIVNFVGRVMGSNGVRYAVTLDNNHPWKLDYHEWNWWVRQWKATSGVCIVILSGKVPPPVPQPMQ